MRHFGLFVLLVFPLGAGCTDSGPSAPGSRDLSLLFPSGCTDGLKDGKETDVDCGGDVCAGCGAGQACLHGSDCDSTICDNNACALPSCTDRAKNGDESDVDCGGSCPACAVTRACRMPADCESGNCVNNVCQPGRCEDGVKNDEETDVDCGGSTCPACAGGKGCLMATDCQSMRCINNVCQSVVNCTAPLANCDGDPQSGCNVNLSTDARNCGKCGNVCPQNMSCSGGKCSTLYAPVGPQTNIPFAQLMGWQQCFVDSYNDSGATALATLQMNCSKARLMLACRATGSNLLALLAWAPRADVLFGTGAMNTNKTHVANGTAWYYDPNLSWGFAPSGTQVQLGPCDTLANVENGKRLCWNTGTGSSAPANTMARGFRCGEKQMAANGWERLVLQAD